MNDETPRRYRGSLIERAAEQFHFAPQPVQPAQPTAVDPEIVQPDIAPVMEPIAEWTAEPVEAWADEPGFVPESVLQPIEGIAAIDRELLRESGMLLPGGPVTPLAEEFRMVKRQLLLTARAVAAGSDAKAADRARMILVCSAKPNEGKTFCAINLALSMAAEKDMEILLVDADFAKPDVLARLGLPKGPGLLDALSGAVDDVEDCIVETDVPQLSVLPAGTRTNSDTELLASDRARAILDGLAAANPRRIVIFDSPPALAASPASVLALHVGQAMLVVRADATSEGDLREAVQLLDGCEHIQLVLNSVSFQPGGRRFGSYYGEMDA
ncbi:MAG: AAA family ATPase [Sphingomonas sp.]|uniref:AAA family ATPase n=1 Tax=Sphingomonas sp. TaxID=28214 RepID=UPI001AFE06A5|nr:AAA family ATPase [Sphingomonas sp.]MBO9623601.1 AAA family ATPase [Sphingomonas sp.]